MFGIIRWHSIVNFAVFVILKNKRMSTSELEDRKTTRVSSDIKPLLT